MGARWGTSRAETDEFVPNVPLANVLNLWSHPHQGPPPGESDIPNLPDADDVVHKNPHRQLPHPDVKPLPDCNDPPPSSFNSKLCTNRLLWIALLLFLLLMATAAGIAMG
jgi:hypothetical protein